MKPIKLMSLFYFLISLNHAYGMISSKAITSDRPKNPDTQSEQFLPLIPLIPASPRMPWQKHLKQPSSPRSEPETMTCLPTLLGTHLPSSPLSPRMPWQNALVRSKFKKSESGQDPLFQTNSDSLDDLDTLLGFIKVFTNTTKDWVGKVSLMETPKFNKKNAQILEKTIDNYYQDLMNKTSWLMSDPPDLDIVNLEYKLNIHSIKMLKPIHYIEKLFIKKMARKKIYFFGSINGDTDTLLKILHALFLKKIITNDFHLSDLNHYLVFLGNYTSNNLLDQAVLYLIMKLKVMNHSNIYLLRGKQEFNPSLDGINFAQDRIKRLQSALPLAIFFVTQSDDFQRESLVATSGGLATELKYRSLILNSAKYNPVPEEESSAFPLMNLDLTNNQDSLQKKMTESGILHLVSGQRQWEEDSRQDSYITFDVETERFFFSEKEIL